jgi:hypothetical protein
MVETTTNPDGRCAGKPPQRVKGLSRRTAGRAQTDCERFRTITAWLGHIPCSDGGLRFSARRRTDLTLRDQSHGGHKPWCRHSIFARRDRCLSRRGCQNTCCLRRRCGRCTGHSNRQSRAGCLHPSHKQTIQQPDSSEPAGGRRTARHPDRWLGTRPSRANSPVCVAILGLDHVWARDPWRASGSWD